MDRVIDFIIIQVNAGNVGLGLFILAILYAFKKEPSKIFMHFTEQAKGDIRFAKELLESEKLSVEASDFIREKFEQMAFKKFYGISANAKFRKYLVSFYDQHYPNINWIDLKRAYQHYDFDGEKIVVSLSRGDKLSNWFITTLFVSLFIFALLIMSGAFILLMFSDLPRNKFFPLFFLGCSLLVSSVIFSSVNWSYTSAKKIDKVLNGSGVP